MKRDVTVASVSWINETPNPIWFAGKSKLLEPAWIPKTYVGLVATSNPTPSASINDFKQFRDGKEFRAFTFCRLRITTDDRTNRLTAVEVVDAIHDPGWTPPFRVTKFPSVGLMGWLDGWESFKQAWGFTYHAGEASPLSKVYTQSLHPHTTLAAYKGADEEVLVSALIKFRAGKHTDDVGIEQVGAPFHVPWVWCDTLLTWANGTLKLYGRGSIFPSHAWYVDGTQVKTVAQVSDTSFPSKPVVIGPPAYIPIPGPRIVLSNPFQIDTSRLNVYPVLKAGIGAGSPQVPIDADLGRKDPVETHPYTAAGGVLQSYP